MRRLIAIVAFSLAACWLAGPAAHVAVACPMCKAANETEDAQPKAYMYSILFMLTVPALIGSGIGVGLYRLNKSEAAQLHEFEQREELA